MKKEVLLVPKNKFPIDVLGIIGEDAKNSWIFLHENVIEKMREKCFYSHQKEEDRNVELFSIDAPNYIIIGVEKNNTTKWSKICHVYSNEYGFIHEHIDPENIFFVKMKE